MSDESLGSISLQVSIDEASAIRDAIKVGLEAGNQISKQLQDQLLKGGVASGKAAKQGIEKELSGVKTTDLKFTSDSLNAVKRDINNLYALTSRPINLQVTVLGLDQAQRQINSLSSSKVSVLAEANTDKLEKSISKSISDGFNSGSKLGVLSLVGSLASTTIALPATLAKNIAGGLAFGISNELSKNLATGLTQALDRGISKSFGSTQLLGDKLGSLLGNSIKNAMGEGLDSLPETFNKVIQSLGDKIPAISGITGKLGKEVKKGLEEDIKEFREVGKAIKEGVQVVVGSENIAREGLYVRGVQRKQSQQKLKVAQSQGVEEWRGDLRSGNDLVDRYADVGENVSSELPKLTENLRASKAERSSLMLKMLSVRKNGESEPGELEALKKIYLEVTENIAKTKSTITEFSKFDPAVIQRLEQRKSKAVDSLSSLTQEADVLRGKPKLSDSQYNRAGDIAAQIAVLEKKIQQTENKLNTYKQPLIDARAKSKESYGRLEAVTPEVQPKAYLDVIREVFGKDLKTDKIPQLVADKRLKGAGEYNSGLNRISVTPEIYAAIISDTLSTLQATTLAHELVHGKQSNLGSFEGIQAIKQKRSLTPLRQATPEFLKDNGSWLSQYADPGTRALEVDAQMTGSDKATSYMSSKVSDKAMMLKVESIKAFDTFYSKTLIANKKSIDELKSKISEGEAIGLDVSKYQFLLDGQREKNKDIAVFLNDVKKQLITASIPDETSLQSNEDFVSKAATVAANQSLAINDKLAKIEQIFEQDLINSLQQKREDTKGSLGTLNRKKELDPLAKEFGIETKGLNKKQVVDKLSQVDDIVSLSDRTNEITRSKAQAQIQRRQQLQNVAETVGSGARSALNMGQTALSSTVAQNVLTAGKDSLSALSAVAKVGYGVLEGAESFALDLIPMGRTLKGVGQQVLLPAATFGLASHMLPGGTAISEGLGSLAQSAANPMISSASQMMSSGVSDLITSAVPNVMGIQAQVSGAVTGLITEGVTTAGELFVQGLTVVMGGKAIQATVGKAIPQLSSDSSRKPLALPQAKEKVTVLSNARTESEPQRLKLALPSAESRPKPESTAILAPAIETSESVLVEEVENSTKVAATEILSQARFIGGKIRSLYSEFTKAKKSGDDGLATQLASAVRDYSAKYKESLAEARQALGSQAGLGTTLGNQLSSQEGQIGKSQKAAERYLTVREKMKSADPSSGDDLSLQQLNKKQISSLSPDQIKILEEADRLLNSLNEKLLRFSTVSAQSSNKSNKILNTPDVENEFQQLEAGVEVEKMKGITLHNLTEEQGNQLQLMESQVNSKKGKILTPLAQESTEAEKGFDKFANTLGFVTKSAVGLGALAFIAPMFASFANESIKAAEAMERLSVKATFAEGSTRKAAESMAYAKNVAKELGVNQMVSIDAFAGLSASTKDTNLEGDATKQIFRGLSEGGASRQLTKNEMSGVFLAVKQMSDKGVVSQEELRGQLSERLAGTMAVAARSRGQTVQEMNRDIKTGTVTSEEFLPKFAQQLSAESALSLPTAMSSSTAIANRFENSIQDVQVTLGKGLLPAKNLGLELLTRGLETLIAITPVLINLGSVLAMSWGGSLVKSFAASGLGARLLSLSLSGVGDAAMKALPSVVKLGSQMLLFGVAVEVFKALKSVISDASGELKGFAETSAKGLDNYQKLNDSFQNKDKPVTPKSGQTKPLENTALVDGTFLGGMLPKSINDESSLGEKIGYGARFGLGFAERGLQKAISYTPLGLGIRAFGGDPGATFSDKQKNDRLVTSGNLTTTTAATTNEMQKQLTQSGSAIKVLEEADAKLTDLLEKRRALVALDPGNTEALKALETEEKQIIKNIEVASKSTTALSSTQKTNIEGLKAAIEEFEKLSSEPGENQESYKASLEALKVELEAAEATQSKFNASLKAGSDAFTLFSMRIQSVFDKLADGTEKIKNLANASKLNVVNEQLSGNLSSEQAARVNQNIDTQSLQKQLELAAESISKLSSELESQSSVLKAYKVTPDMGQAELATLGERASNPKDKKVIGDYAKLEATKIQAQQLESELAQSKLAVQQQLKDTTKQIVDFFKTILEQTNQISVETKSAKNKVAMMKAESKLRTALLGFQESFASTYVEGLIGFLTSLNKPLEDAINAQGQLLSNASNLRNTLLQGAEQRKGIDNGAGYEGRAGVGTPASKLAGSISGALDASGQNGADMPVGANGEITSYHTGEVIQKGNAGNNGNYIVVKFKGDDGVDYEATYSHLGSTLKVGDRVNAGQQLGKFDASGRTSGAHNSVDVNSLGNNGSLQRSQETQGARRQAELLAKGITAGIQINGGTSAGNSNSTPGLSTTSPSGLNDVQKRNAAIIEREARNAGLNKNQTAAMIASAMQESTLGMAKDEVGGYGGKGLFQLTDPEGKSGSWIGKGGINSVNDYYDPAKNTRAVMTDYQFEAWKKKSQNQSAPDAATSFASMVLRPYEVGNKYSGKAKDLFPNGVQGGLTGGSSGGLANNDYANSENNAMLDSASSQAIANNKQQAENIKSQLAASGQLDALKTEQQKQSNTRQFKNSLRDSTYGVTQQERAAEDKQNALGFMTPGKQKKIDTTNAEREFYDNNRDLLKQLEELQAARGTLKASLSVIQKGGFQGADKLQDQVPLITTGIEQTDKNISKIEGLLDKAAKQKNAKVKDINEKFAIEDGKRQAEAASEIANLVSQNQRLKSDMSALIGSPGKDVIGDKSRAEIAEKRSQFSVDEKILAEQMRTEQRTKEEIEVILGLKKDILDQEIRINETMAIREKEKVQREIDNKMFDSSTGLKSGQADLYDAMGMRGASTELRRGMQVESIGKELTDGMVAIDEFARSTNASAEKVAMLRNNLIQLNQVKLDTLKAQFNPMMDITNTAKDAFGGFFKDLITGTKSVKDAFKDMISNILSKVADLAVNALLNDLFSGGKGNGLGGIFGGGKGTTGGQQASGLGGIIGSLASGLFGGGGGSSGGSGGGISGGVGGIFGSVISMFGGGFAEGNLKNFASGNLIDSAMQRERRESGGLRPKLAIVNDRELILSAKQTEKFMRLGLDKQLKENNGRMQNYAEGNLGSSNFASSSITSNAGSTTINVPVTVNAGSDGKKPQINAAAMQASVRVAVTQELLEQRRNSGLLSG